MVSRNIENNSSVFRNVDWFTVVLYLLLVAAGAISIYAASYDFDKANIFDFSEFSGKQLRWIGLSLIIGFIILLLDYRIYEAYAYPIYGIVVLILIATIFLSPNIKGSHSWLVFGPVSLQPAEFGKFATSLALAKLFDSYNFSLNAKPSNYFRALIIIFLPICIILCQKETGSALVYISLIFVLYREGMSGFVLSAIFLAVLFFVLAVKYMDPFIMGLSYGEFSVFTIICVLYCLLLVFYCRDFIIARNVILGICGATFIAVIITLCGVQINGILFFSIVLSLALIYTAIAMLKHHVKKFMISIGFVILSVSFLFSVNYVFDKILQPHQQTRILVLLGIEEDLRGVGYNVNQSKIAIGSGGIEGKGFLNGTQTKLKYVPEQHTDFIFCTIGEEQGFIGSSLVLIAFLVLILRLIYLAERQKSPFSRVYSYCVVSLLIFHVCINVGMVIGLCPVIGIPLPFFSYGGSSLWGFTILLFIMLRLDAARKERRE
ncbi:MAG: rod shape-determining protein RodA [Muribaculaceae bacterium]|nr:rod shape-determining protein RodA [Muribaculaceae bacterium]